MKAIRYHRHGGPEELRYEDVPDPVPSTDELLLRIEAISVSPVNWKIARGAATARSTALPQIPGSEAAGLTPDGRRVVLAGGGHGTQRPGVYAELAAVAVSSLVDIPEGVSFAAAASLGVAYSTAYLALSARANLQAGERVAVLGATGGVGMAAVQVARMLGAGRVVAACRPDAADAVRALGAHEVVDVGREDLGAALVAALGGPAHVIVDPVAGTVGVRGIEALAPFGRQVVLGTAAGDRYEFAVPSLYGKNGSILGFTLFGFVDRLVPTMKALLAAVAAGTLSVLIDRSFPLAEAADAWRYAQARGKLGKVILTP